jgi:hypothetical protein
MAALRLYWSSFLSKDLMSSDKDIIRPSRVYAAVKTIIFRVFGLALRSKWYFFVLSSKESTILRVEGDSGHRPPGSKQPLGSKHKATETFNL